MIFFGVELFIIIKARLKVDVDNGYFYMITYDYDKNYFNNGMCVENMSIML